MTIPEHMFAANIGSESDSRPVLHGSGGLDGDECDLSSLNLGLGFSVALFLGVTCALLVKRRPLRDDAVEVA